MIAPADIDEFDAAVGERIMAAERATCLHDGKYWALEVVREMMRRRPRSSFRTHDETLSVATMCVSNPVNVSRRCAQTTVQIRNEVRKDEG
jgi:hypothetical protein